MLKYALACHGCTREGLDSFQLVDAIIEDVTPMFLTLFGSEDEARDTLHEVRKHSEAVLNYKPRSGGASEFKPAFSYPRDPVDADSKHTYSSYVKMREYLLLFYVKEHDQPKATLLRIDDSVIEAKVDSFRERGLRWEPKVHAKWLKRNGYHKVAAWEDNPEPYRALLNLIRSTFGPWRSQN